MSVIVIVVEYFNTREEESSHTCVYMLFSLFIIQTDVIIPGSRDM